MSPEGLGLQPHPEGGWYRRTWTSPVLLDGGRPAASAIQFLLMPGERSAPHVVDADELWLWHGPGTLHLLVGESRIALGPDRPQVLVPAGVEHRPPSPRPTRCWSAAWSRPASGGAASA